MASSALPNLGNTLSGLLSKGSKSSDEYSNRETDRVVKRHLISNINNVNNIFSEFYSGEAGHFQAEKQPRRFETYLIEFDKQLETLILRYGYGQCSKD